MHPFPTTVAAAATIVVTLFILCLPGTTQSSLTTDTTTTTTTSTESAYLPNCTQPFSCGHLQDLTYPFSGGDRPSYCGLPELHLACQNGTALLTLDSIVYLVNEVNQAEKTMSLSRLDLFNTTCTTQLLDTTLNGAVLSLTSNDANLTLFYACNGSLKPPNVFSCDVNGAPSDANYLIGLVPDGPIPELVQCNLTVRVPMLANRVGELEGNGSLLGEVLREGFEASYGGNYGEAECEACLSRSGGECGFDPNERIAVCICGGRLCSEKDSKNASFPIGIGIGGAATFGIFLGVLFLIFVQRRKRKAAAENQSKELLSQPTINKNKNVHTQPVDLSMSIPPYPYSNSHPKSDPQKGSSKSDPQKGSSYFGLQVFSFTELEEATDNFNPVKELGTGGFGSVYHGILRDGRSVAVKRLFDNSMKREEQFMNEVEILNRLRHRNLVTLYGCTSRRTRELIFVYEYVPNGTVADHIHGEQSKSRFLPWPVRLNIAIETADALAYLHTSDVIHRDVKTNNILLDNNFRVKVADFGLSRLFPNNVTHVSTAPQGTPGYVDPEYYNTYQLTDKSDVYSFGVVLIELISSLPAVDTSRQRLDINLANMAVTKIQSGSISELIDPLLGSDKDNAVRKMATSIAELAFRCLQQERDMRPTMNEVQQALRRIQNENCPTGKCETVVEIGEDDVSLLKKASPPLSPDSVETDQWISSSTLSSS